MFFGGGVSNLKLPQSGEITKFALRCRLGMLVVSYNYSVSMLFMFRTGSEGYV